MATYVELQVTSHFSFLRGASSPEELFSAAALLGHSALGLTDWGGVPGIVRGWRGQKATGVRMIAGARVDLTGGRALLLYPTDRAAWSRLTRLLSVGKARGGNFERLVQLGKAAGIEARAVPPVMDDGTPVSSSRVRDALREGDPQEAARLLTRPFAIRGVVQHGDKRGREIGYPTANLPVEHYLRPRYGIYAVTGRILSTGQELKGAANIGVRPQFDPPKELLEPYFFDFQGDLYGQRLSVELIDYLRPEAKFDSLDALVAQMDADCARARTILSSHNPA